MIQKIFVPHYTDDIRDWINENLYDRTWHWGGIGEMYLFLDNEEDATAFKLKFGKQEWIP